MIARSFLAPVLAAAVFAIGLPATANHELFVHEDRGTSCTGYLLLSCEARAEANRAGYLRAESRIWSAGPISDGPGSGYASALASVEYALTIPSGIHGARLQFFGEGWAEAVVAATIPQTGILAQGASVSLTVSLDWNQCSCHARVGDAEGFYPGVMVLADDRPDTTAGESFSGPLRLDVEVTSDSQDPIDPQTIALVVSLTSYTSTFTGGSLTALGSVNFSSVHVELDPA